METLKFRTNIKCGGCVEKVTPALNQAVGANAWQVDLSVPERFLTVKPKEYITAQEVKSAVESAGFKAEQLEMD